MTLVAKFTFNPFQENTYILYDDSLECIIIDPGCYTDAEKQELQNFISEKQLKPVRLINTHCHLDHIFGNQFIANTYNLGLEIHQGELPVLASVPQVCQAYGLPLPDASPEPSRFIETGEIIEFGQSSLKSLFTPGHSPASLSFYCVASQFIIAGDVLFYGSIGRTDLPGGSLETLLQSIRTELLPLGDAVEVYPGHGPKTNIGFEKANNPFLNR